MVVRLCGVRLCAEMVRVVFGVFVLTACRFMLFACRAVLLACRVRISRASPCWLSPRVACCVLVHVDQSCLLVRVGSECCVLAHVFIVDIFVCPCGMQTL